MSISKASLRKVLNSRTSFIAAAALFLSAPANAKVHHLLYAAVPGVRNYLQYGGSGVVVFDMDNGYKFLKRIPTWPIEPGKQAENIKGISADAKTGRLYITTPNRLAAFDLKTDKIIWQKSYELGFDRAALSPDGKTLYVPSFEGPVWDVIDASNGNLITKIETGTGSHNTIWSPDGSRVYLGGLHNNYLLVADPSTNKVVEKIGPFLAGIRPFTIDGSNSHVYVNTDGLLGFQVGDVKTGKVLATVTVKGYEQGPVKRHGCPSHGIALSHDEKELWVADGHNNYVHIFDNTVMPPRQVASIKTTDMPGWMFTTSDGRFVIPSEGDVINQKTHKIVYTLRDETGTQLQTEKMVEIDFDDGKPVSNNDQFGIGGKR